jgi:tetratricopeptide (TPR) repeat protein
MSEKSLAEIFKIPCPREIDQKKAIMVVEDQQDMRLIITHHLGKMGYSKVIQMANGYDALEFLKTNKDVRISVIISDIDMPVIGGYQLLAEIRDNPDYERPPFILALDNPSKEKIMYAVENGVDEIMVKPFTLNDIFPKLQSGFQKFHNPKNPEKVYELAKQLYRESKFPEAEKIYQAIANETQKSARPWVGLAKIAAKMSDHNKALKLLEEAEKRNPNYVHLYSIRGEILIKHMQPEEAIQAFTKAIELSPLNPLRYQDAAKPMFDLKMYKEGVEVLEIAIKHQLNFPSLHHYLSEGNFALKDYKKALRHIRSALSVAPENVTYLNQLGICLKETNDFEGAMSTYNSIIKLDPDNKAVLYNKAVLQFSMGDKADAIKTLTRATTKFPDFGAAKNKLEEYKKAG